MDIAVLYLAWLPYGPTYFKDFLDNYLKTPAGYPHKLVILFNGVALANDEILGEFKLILASKKIDQYEILQFDKGQDIEIYQKASHLVRADFFLFLNTYSKFNTENWLKLYVSNWNENIGLIGATASYASYRSAIYEQVMYDLQGDKPLSVKINSLKYLFKILLLHRNRFKKFPAPHIRTNAFFTSKTIFNSIPLVKVSNKMEAYYFENGKNSMTQQVLRMRLHCIVIDRYGTPFNISAWASSKTFWIDNQENLLISDNQTNNYHNASHQEKKLFNKIAWNV
jgi:hypothetical protein